MRSGEMVLSSMEPSWPFSSTQESSVIPIGAGEEPVGSVEKPITAAAVRPVVEHGDGSEVENEAEKDVTRPVQVVIFKRVELGVLLP